MMISRVPQNVSARLIGSSLFSTLGLPPKNPPDDDDENAEDDEDNDEEEEEPAVIREPDEC
jgi:Ran GTPase-activating protein (RanGAP) involved in mRNA processing and transport